METLFRIKICGITNMDDARLAVDAGADALGLNFSEGSRRFVDPETAREIVAALPAEVTKVGVFVNRDASEIVAIAAHAGLNCVQLHGDERPGLLALLPNGIRVMRAHRCGTDGLSTLSHYLDECRAGGRLPDAVLIDADGGAEFGGTGRVADWSRISDERASLLGLPLVLAGGLMPENVGAAIASVHPDAVDVASGVERETGRKDKDRLERFVTAARAALAVSHADQHDRAGAPRVRQAG